MTRRADIAARLPLVLALDEADAAASLSLSAGTFRKMVQEGRMPRPRREGTRLLYDVAELRMALRELPRDGDGPGKNNPWDEVLVS